MKIDFHRHNINYPLIIGTFIVAFLALVCIYPEYFSAADPFAVQRLQFGDIQTASEYITPPVPPGKDYPWGTDTIGRDMKSLIIYGAKATIFMAVLVALLRMLISIPLAILMAYRNKPIEWFVQKFNKVFNAFPLIIIVLVISRLQLISDLFEYKSTVIIILLTVFGWSRLTSLLSRKVKEVLEQDFIEGEMAIGKTRLEIAIQNILPHIIPTIAILFFLEVASALLIIAQLGVFGLALDGGYYDTSDTQHNGELMVPSEFDWASLLMFAYLLFGSHEMWLVIFPATAFAISIIGFNMLGEGLRFELEKRNSKIISWIKALPGFLSPFRLYYEIRNIKIYKFDIAKKAFAYTLILLLIISPSLPSQYTFNTANAVRIAKELSSDQYLGRLIGPEEMQSVTEFIASEISSYGLLPLNGSYIHTFNSKIGGAKLEVLADGAAALPLDYMNEFSVNSDKEINQVFSVTPFEFEDLESSSKALLQKYDGKILLLDSRGIDPKKLAMTLMKLSYTYKPQGMMIIENYSSGPEFKLSTNLDKYYNGLLTINVASDTGKRLLELSDFKIQLHVGMIPEKEAKGYNVVGYIPGSDPAYEKDYLVIGSNLDYKGVDSKAKFSGEISSEAIAIELELIRNIVKSGIKPKKTMIFAFWDCTNKNFRGSNGFAQQYMEIGAKNSYYIDLSSFATKKSRNLILDTSKTIPKNYISQEYIKIFKKHSRIKGIPIKYERVYNPALDDFLGIGKQVLIFGSDGERTVFNKAFDFSKAINIQKLDQYGQVIVDTIIEIAQK